MTSVMLSFTAKQFVARWGFRSFRCFPQISVENRPIPGYNGSSKMFNKDMAVVRYVNYSDHANSSWERPEGPPRVWRVFEGKKKSADDGKIPRFTIQDVPKERIEDVIEFMLKYLVQEEAWFVTFGVAKNPLAEEDMRSFLRNKSRQGMSIFALAENSDSGTKPLIVGANILTVITAHDKAHSLGIDQFKSKPLREFFGSIFDLENEVDVLNKYSVDKYLGSVGLACHPSFRGNGIAEQLLKAREDIGRAYQIPVTEASFTMKGSQIAGTRAGFKLQLQREYSEILDSEGNLVFPGETGKFVHVMTKRLY